MGGYFFLGLERVKAYDPFENREKEAETSNRRKCDGMVT